MARPTPRTCSGAHHHDTAEFDTCDTCGRDIARAGRRVYATTRGPHGQLRFVCWHPHTCDPEHVALWQQAKAHWIAEGRIVKGQTVTVVRGRKVPIGTTGTVFYIGDTGYGERVGIHAADGAKHFTARANVEACPSSTREENEK